MKPIFRDRLEEVVGNIEIECSGGMLGVGGDGDNRTGKGASFQKIETHFLAEREVEKKQIRHAFVYEGGGLGDAGCLSAYLNVRESKKGITKILTTEGFVIDQDGS
jgi:hypothetical protein